MISRMNGGNGWASKVWPVVSFTMTPASASTFTTSPWLMASTASGHSMMARPVLMELR